MKPKIKNSKAKWKIAYGHQPWVSIGDHGNAPKKLNKYFTELFSEGNIDIYICGDDHNKQLIKKTLKNGKEMLLAVCGTGGRETDKPYNLENVDSPNDDLHYFSSTYGIGEIIIDNDTLTIKFFDTRNNLEYEYPLKKILI
tara:strand:- start:69 stop:491 length:423 start_codon:yes stop_codon:yes gene_type:complete